jgi:hypothetical protein
MSPSYHEWEGVWWRRSEERERIGRDEGKDERGVLSRPLSLDGLLETFNVQLFPSMIALTGRQHVSLSKVSQKQVFPEIRILAESVQLLAGC